MSVLHTAVGFLDGDAQAFLFGFSIGVRTSFCFLFIGTYDQNIYVLANMCRAKPFLFYDRLRITLCVFLQPVLFGFH